MNLRNVKAITQGEPAEAMPASGTARQGVELGGRWRLESALGFGGMGEVWRARHNVLGRQAAVKLLTSPSAANRARILREAQILASLRHDAIVEVFDIGEHEGTPYFVMDWIDGETLAHTVERAGPLTGREAARAFVPLLDGLAVAHGAGIVHRDVKPDNVLIVSRSDGTLRLVLIDFGIAQLGGRDSKLTATGALVGTPEYMAPEVLRGAEADERADVWGAAATLYEAISGTSPFRRDDFVATVRAVTEDAPRPLPGGAPAALRAIVERGLEKVPTKRFSSAYAMRDALEEWLSGSATPHERSTARTQPAQPDFQSHQPPIGSPTRPSATRPAEGSSPSVPPSSLEALIREKFGKR